VNGDVHERARMLIACAEQESWLAEHLESCTACREFADRAGAVVRSLRNTPVAAGWDLVSRTQMRVRERSRELQLRQERLWAIWVCCAAVTLIAGLTTAALWSGLAWIGERISLDAPVWEMGFVVFSLLPTVVTAILLLARGTHLADTEEI